MGSGYCLEVCVYDCHTRGREVYDLVFDQPGAT